MRSAAVPAPRPVAGRDGGHVPHGEICAIVLRPHHAARWARMLLPLLRQAAHRLRCRWAHVPGRNQSCRSQSVRARDSAAEAEADCLVPQASARLCGRWIRAAPAQWACAGARRGAASNFPCCACSTNPKPEQSSGSVLGEVHRRDGRTRGPCGIMGTCQETGRRPTAICRLTQPVPGSARNARRSRPTRLPPRATRPLQSSLPEASSSTTASVVKRQRLRCAIPF